MKTKTDRVCYYHVNCWDGMGSAWAVWKHFPETEFIATQYSDGKIPTVAGKKVYIVDFSFHPNIMDSMILHCHELTLLDHHPHANDYVREMIRSRRYEAWGFICEQYRYDAEWIQLILTRMTEGGVQQVIHLEYDLHRSGARMTWDHLAGSSFNVPKIIQHMSDYDRWKFEIPGTKTVMAGLGQYPIKLETYKTFMDEEALTERFMREGPVIEQYRKTMIDTIIETTQRTLNIGGYDVPVVNCPKAFVSETLARLAVGQPFAAAYFDTPTIREMSFRSSVSGIKVNEIARMYGGNGHDHAAGIMLPRDHPLAQL